MRPLAVIGNVNVDLIVGPVAPWPKLRHARRQHGPEGASGANIPRRLRQQR